jgi:D-alanine-D-alanine ligase
LTGIVVAHNAVGDTDDPSTRDVLAQVEYVTGALAALGLDYRVVAVGPEGVDGAAFGGAAAVVNLVESPPNRPGFQVDAAAAFERLGLAVTGSSAATIAATTDKEGTRHTLAAVGIAVAPGGRLDPDRPEILERVPPPWILKPALEDASLGLDDDAVTSDPRRAVARARELGRLFPGQPVLVEHLLPGRELNVSLLGGSDGPEVLPPAEMVFVDFPADEPRIVGFKAKWDETSFAYRHTVRRFLDPSETALQGELEIIAAGAWNALGLAGYGRVDLRLDEGGEPRVLEVNANPCLSADAGFAAAAAAAGLEPCDVVRRILVAAGWRTT